MIDPAPNSADDAAQPPAGFQRVQTGGSFAVNNGPLFARWTLGVKVEAYARWYNGSACIFSTHAYHMASPPDDRPIGLIARC